MRPDRLTSKFQLALADAQSLAVGRDHQFIEPVHLMLALLDQQGGSARPLLDKAGVNVNLLRSRLLQQLDRIASVEGTAGDVQASNDLSRLLNVTDKLAQKRGDQYISSELAVLAALEDRGALGTILKESGAVKGAIDKAITDMRGGEKIDDPNAEEQRGALEKFTLDLTARAESGKLDPVIGRDDEIRRTDPGTAAAHQEQPGADRRAGRRQDRDRRRTRAAHRQWRGARGTQEQAHPGARHGRADRGHEVPRRIRGAPEGRSERSGEAGGPGHPVHRRIAHDGRRRQGRGFHGRRQHAEAGARARRAALRRRDYAR